MNPRLKEKLDSGWAITSETSVGWQLTRKKEWNRFLLRVGSALFVVGLVFHRLISDAIYIGAILIFCACIAFALKSDEIAFVSKTEN